MEIRPNYRVGDRVIHCRPGMGFSGVVHTVVKPDEMNECLDAMREDKGYQEIENSLNWYRQRDPDALKNPVYVIVPDGYDKPATWEQAQLICPTLTEYQYRRIVGSRMFIVLESDIIPEEWEFNENQKD